MIPYILTDNSLTIVVDGKALTMENSNPSFNEAKKLLSQEKYDELPNLFDTPMAVEKFAEGNISVSDGEVRYGNEVIHNHVVGRILDFMRQGLPYKPLVRFLDKLMDNPSRRAVNELYAFLEHKAMPLTPDGNFLAYKGVRSDYTDWHSGKFGLGTRNMHCRRPGNRTYQPALLCPLRLPVYVFMCGTLIESLNYRPFYVSDSGGNKKLAIR